MSRHAGGEPNDVAHLAGKLRAIRRATLILVWTLVSLPIQASLNLVPGSAKLLYRQLYWRVFCWLMGLALRRLGQVLPGGTMDRTPGARSVVYVVNHCSWLDVAVLGSTLPASFVSKADVARWPLVNLVARLGQTVYVSRQRAATGRERDDMRHRLAQGDNLILFPEGTTSDGTRVLPFRSSFLSAAVGEPAPLIQPVSVVYDRLGGLPAVRSTRPLFAYYGDMSIGSHFWRLAQYRGLRVSVLLHAPLDPRHFAGRKPLALAAWQPVAEGAAALRQNRPAQPLSAPLPTPSASAAQ